ncbi:MAG: alpha/beta hydrolase [Paracoccus sp. (in: a-proteobacteria)]|uniref:alpha/beta fold hydrolase n=1 Tax=Paracoccus sp. TaxID=267 RepID=UPI0026DFEC5E|nr:alpha/beta hydrolase [Paracoccus sp. (in: a-proteobacteria)]MDO5621430.1 alpha/beta hydrolase [Paracoccus sp. (in: a-proteobacteria)]
MTLPFSDHQIAVPGGTVFLRDWPGRDDLPPVLLLHDSLGAVALWRDFPARLAQATERRVLAYDRLGFGQSTPLQDRPALDFIAAEARSTIPALTEALALDRFVICGHSVGGGMAVETAAQHPDHVAALITIAAQAMVEDCTREGVLTARKLFASPAALAQLERYHGDKARWVLDAWTEIWPDPAFADWSLRDVLPRVTCPTLALHGENDEYASSRQPQMIAELTHGRLQILPRTGHVPHRESPDLLIEAICAFLVSLR